MAFDEAASLLRGGADWLPAYDRASFLNGHLSWHFALLALASDDVEAALKIYEDRIRPAVSENPRLPPLNVFTDSASLLWRLALVGTAGLELHWRDVAVYSDRIFPRAGVHFADVHWALVASATQSEGSTKDWLSLKLYWQTAILLRASL